MTIVSFLLDPLTISKHLHIAKKISTKTKRTPTQDLRTPCFSGLLERIVFPNTAQGRKHFVMLHSSQNKEWPLLALTPACVLQAWTPNISAIYRCTRGSGDTSGSQSFPIEPETEKCARQQNYKSLGHNFNRKHSALIGIASSHPCYANPVTRTLKRLWQRGPLWKKWVLQLLFS